MNVPAAVRVGALARAMAAAMQAEPGDYAPRILCFATRLMVPAPLPPGWNPERYEIGIRRRGRWWRRLARRLLPRDVAATPAILFIAATPAGLRITLGGVRADTSALIDRS